MRKTVQKCHQNLLQKTKMCFSFWGRLRPQTPYRGSRRIPLGDPSQRRRAIYALEARAPPPDSVVTVVNSLQNRVNSITLCITLNAKTGKIVLMTLCIQIE